MTNEILQIAGLQIVRGDDVETYIRSIDMLLAQNNQRLRIAIANVQTQRQMIDALQRRLAAAEDRINVLEPLVQGVVEAPVIDVTDVPKLENDG